MRDSKRRNTVRTLVVTAALLALGAPATATAAPPANDAFATPVVLDTESGDDRIVTIGATKEPGEPNHAGNTGGRSVWFLWTAPADGQCAFDTLGSSFDTLLGVYTGSSVDTLTLVAENDDTGTEGEYGSMVSFTVTAGTEYRIAVDGFGGKAGAANLRWQTAPANDNLADAADLVGRFGSVAGSTEGATWEPGESLEDDVGTVWYRWTAPSSGPFSFSTAEPGGSDALEDTVLTGFQGDAIDSLELVAYNDDDPMNGYDCCLSRMVVHATAGETYLVQVSGFDENGTFVLEWRPVIFGSRKADVLIGTADNEEFREGSAATSSAAAAVTTTSSRVAGTTSPTAGRDATC